MRIVRFGIVGAVNTLVDFTILNLLVVGLSVHGGVLLVLCNACSFTVANLNSYLLNKQWTFRDRSRKNFRQFLLFLIFSLGGLSVNSLVLYLLTSAPFEAALEHRLIWINASKVIATGASMIWNFLTYRHFVFNPREAEDPAGKVSPGDEGSAESRPSAAADSPFARSNKQ